MRTIKRWWSVLLGRFGRRPVVQQVDEDGIPYL